MIQYLCSTSDLLQTSESSSFYVTQFKSKFDPSASETCLHLEINPCIRFSVGSCWRRVEVCSGKALVLLFWRRSDTPSSLQSGSKSKNHSGSDHGAEVPAPAAQRKMQWWENRNTTHSGRQINTTHTGSSGKCHS